MILRRIGVVGRGKTGGKLVELARDRFAVTVFDSASPLTVERAREADLEALAVFVPGNVFPKILPTLLETRLPVVIGTTGFTFPEGVEGMDRRLRTEGIPWVYGSNFALGMPLAEAIIRLMARAESLLENGEFAINEIHHTAKLDAPSGTALSWKEWLGREVPVTSERIGDTVGVHSLTLSTPFEKITLTHEALDRSVFASGAHWAVEKILDNQVNAGLTEFRSLINFEIGSR